MRRIVIGAALGFAIASSAYAGSPRQEANAGGTDLRQSPATYYAAPGGSDSNACTTWARPCKTVTAALLRADGAGGGRVFVANDTWASPVSGAGVWISHIKDTGSHPAGWIRMTTQIEIEMAPTIPSSFGLSPQARIAPGGGAKVFSDSVLEYHGGVGGFTVRNLIADSNNSSPAVRLGLSSPLPAWSGTTTYTAGDQVQYRGLGYTSRVKRNVSHQPDSSPAYWTARRPKIPDGRGVSLTALVRFENCFFQRNGPSVAPAVDVGYLFWAWFERVVFSRNYVTGSDPFSDAALRLYATGGTDLDTTSSYLLYIRDARFNGGGIYSYGGNSGELKTVFGENMAMPVLLTKRNPWTGGGIWTATDVQSADSAYRFTFDTTDNTGGSVEVLGTSGTVLGPAIISSDAYAANSHDLATGKQGRLGTLSLLYHDAGRRQFAIIPSSQYPNIAPQPLEQGSGALVRAPDGLADGGRHMVGTNYHFFHEGAGPDQTVAVGDRIAWGGWYRFVDNDPTDQGARISNDGSASAGQDVTVYLGSGADAGHTRVLSRGLASSVLGWMPKIPIARYQWVWLSGWLRVVKKDVGSTLSISGALPGVEMARTWAIKIPASSDTSDDEVAQLALNAGPTPTHQKGTTRSSPTAGYPSLWPGQKLGIWDAALGGWAYLDIENGTLRGAKPSGAAGGSLAGSTYPNPTIAGHAVSYPMLQQVSGRRLLGNPNGTGADASEITLGPGLSFSGSTLVATAATSELTYYVELTSAMIRTIKAADQYIATSSHDTLFGPTRIEYPVAGTLPSYAHTDVCIIGANTITSGAIDVNLSINGTAGPQVKLNSSSAGCRGNSTAHGGAATTDTVGIVLRNGGGAPAVSGTLRLAIKVKVGAASTF